MEIWRTFVPSASLIHVLEVYSLRPNMQAGWLLAPSEVTSILEASCPPSAWDLLKRNCLLKATSSGRWDENWNHFARSSRTCIIKLTHRARALSLRLIMQQKLFSRKGFGPRINSPTFCSLSITLFFFLTYTFGGDGWMAFSIQL